MQARFHCFFLMTSLFAGVATAQNSAATRVLSGTIQDQSGALIPGANIDVVTGNGRPIAHGISDNAGSFSFPNIVAGSYIVDVTRDGFGEVKQTIRLGTQGRAQLRIVMQVASVSQEVTVAAADSSMQVTTEIGQNQSGNSIDRNVLDRLPFFDQDYITTMS